MSTAAAPPGWYADPDGGLQQRWWDGTQWTAEYAPLPPPTDPRALWDLTTMYLQTEAGVNKWAATVLDEAGTPIGSARHELSGLVPSCWLFDAAGTPQLRLTLRIEVAAPMLRRRFARFDLLDPGGSSRATLDVHRHQNFKTWLKFQIGEEQVGTLEPDGKGMFNAKQNALYDATGSRIGRADQVADQRHGLHRQTTWQLWLGRPLAPPLDSVALAAAALLPWIQIWVAKSAD